METFSSAFFPIEVEKFCRDDVTFYCCTSPEDGELVNAQIIETKSVLIIVDTMLLRSHSTALRKFAESLLKPIDRVIITHAHPDHCLGIESFQDVPTFALAETIEEIKFLSPQAIPFLKTKHGDDITDDVITPANALTEGQQVIDDVLFNFAKVANAEDIYLLVIELPQYQTLIAQDLVYNEVHLFVAQFNSTMETCFRGWLEALTAYQARASSFDLILPGHGKATHSGVFKNVIGYLTIARECLESSSDPAAYIERMTAQFPAYRLMAMLEMSAGFYFAAKSGSPVVNWASFSSPTSL